MAMQFMDMIDLDEVLDLTRKLIAFRTVNPPGDEEPAVRFLGWYLAERGIGVEYQQVEPNRANLIARLPGRGESGHLILSGHMDVVPPGDTSWRHDPFDAVREGDRLVGRGAADMKGGVAAMAVAFLTLAREGFEPRGDLILAVSAGEERGGAPGAHLMVSSGILAGAANLIVGEPTGLDICTGQKGVVRWQITAFGRAAHSSTSHLGTSAIAYMARLVPLLESNPFPFEPSALLGAPTISVTTIEGGHAFNVIPDRCGITALGRLVPGQSIEALSPMLEQLLERVAVESGLAVRTEVETMGLSALETPRDCPLVEAASEAVAEATGHTPAILGFTGATEAAVLAPPLGASMVIVGPGTLEQAHRTDEYVEIPQLGAAARAYIGIIERILG
ncbi:MAG: M20 family metallopeptidase [Chloroflexota bacterium]|nr:M20 family metallopeptidase [Chloroflexota bacterium]